MPLPFSSLVVLAGGTGAGKSAVLKQLHQQGFPILDLEALARHSGSAFGHLLHDGANSRMEFLKTLETRSEALQHEPLVFTECKGNTLGNVALPTLFLQQLRSGFIVWFDVPRAARIAYLAQQYENVSPEAFAKAAEKLEGKIAAEKLQAITSFSKAHAFAAAIDLLLAYYDRSAAYTYFKEHATMTLAFEKIDPPAMAETIAAAVVRRHPLFLHGR